MTKTITENEFIATYGPEANADSSYFRWRDWDTPEEQKALEEHAERRQLWTFADDGDGNTFFRNGYGLVNRIAYVFAEVPYAEGEDITVIDDDDETDETADVNDDADGG
jgi:hypothetical protein